MNIPSIDQKSKYYLWLIAFAVIVVVSYRPASGVPTSPTVPETMDVLPTAHAAEQSIETPPKEAQGIPEKEKTQEPVDLHKLAYAVAMAETHNCTKGYGTMYNNCFGIKSGNTAPCPVVNGIKQIGQNRMCIYTSWRQSYDAFKIIWAKWYKKFPDRALAARWTGNDRPDTWLKHVRYYYDRAPQ